MTRNVFCKVTLDQIQSWVEVSFCVSFSGKTKKKKTLLSSKRSQVSLSTTVTTVASQKGQNPERTNHGFCMEEKKTKALISDKT